ncbi:hypothetical protein ABT246_34155 [Streptomyces sp. NPDC001553]|uniref:hypothetical protein n=1 Tax=Streptomyces sp. NPDC001553 TaxID=3154385 RepID=UPI003327CAF3
MAARGDRYKDAPPDGTEGNDPPLPRTIKEPPAGASPQSILAETDKLLAVRTIGLPRDLFTGIAGQFVAGWHARAAAESPSQLGDHLVPLPAAFLHTRERELTDTLADLLITLSGLMRR